MEKEYDLSPGHRAWRRQSQDLRQPGPAVVISAWDDSGESEPHQTWVHLPFHLWFSTLEQVTSLFTGLTCRTGTGDFYIACCAVLRDCTETGAGSCSMNTTSLPF